jgi:glycosyltransferase involved in cell wall biosynthesis
VITVSERYADELVSRYGIERPLVLLNCPVLNGRLPSNGSAELLRRTAGLDNDLPIVVFQGLITRERGLEQLIGAAKRLPEVAVVMLGNGTYAEELQRLIDEEGVGDRVKLPGAVPEDELLANTAGGTVGVSPIEGTSISQAYTVQNKIFEYIGAGLPVLATRLPGTAPIIEEYGFGLFFEPGDSDSLAGAIERVLGDRELYEELRAKAVEASKIFNWEQESRKLVSLYTSLGEAVGA